MNRPNFFIVGAPRCGTTAMYTYLKQHPDIFMSELKEPHFFGSDINASYFVRDIKTYLALFSKAKEEKIIGEASTWYLYSKQAAREIKDFSPYAKILIMLRNPVDMLYSLYYHNVYKGYEPLLQFKDALAAESKRRMGIYIPESTPAPEFLFYRDVPRYTKQVQRYLDIFGRKRVHIIIFDDFEKNTAEIYKKTLEFLEIDPNFQPEFQLINPGKRARSKDIRNFLRNPPQFVKKIGRTFTSHSLRQKLIKIANDLNTRYASRPPIAPELRLYLQREFSSEVDQLSKLIDRDLTHWLREKK